MLDLPIGDRLKPKASRFKGPLERCIIFLTLSDFHTTAVITTVLSEQPFSEFSCAVALHSEYCRILNATHHPRSYSN